MIYHRHLPASLPGYFRALYHPKTDFPAPEMGHAAILAPEGRPMVIWGNALSQNAAQSPDIGRPIGTLKDTSGASQLVYLL